METDQEPHAGVPFPTRAAGVVGSGAEIPHGTGGLVGGTAVYARNPLPPYPREAREHRWEGTTLLRMEVLADGTAGKIEIAESSGHSLLDESCVRTVHGWKFLPAHSGNTPIPSIVEIPITFRLADRTN